MSEYARRATTTGSCNCLDRHGTTFDIAVQYGLCRRLSSEIAASPANRAAPRRFAALPRCAPGERPGGGKDTMSYARKSGPTASDRPAHCTVQLKYLQQLQDCIGIGPGPFCLGVADRCPMANGYVGP
jgi:hypothetical protein